MKKIAILSATGSGKKRTIPALKNSEIATVVAIHGRESEKIRELSKEWHIEYFTEINDLLKKDFDLLYVASPPFLHKEQIKKCLKLGKPIICEKPLCITASDAKYFEKEFESNSQVMVAHHLRHQKAIVRIKELIDNRSLGDVRSAMFQWNFPLNKSAPNASWKLDPKLGGDNPFYDAGIHTIDMSLLLFGNPESVYASGFESSVEGMYETVTAILRFKSFNVCLNASSNQTTVGNDLIIYFEHGFIRAPQAFSEKSIGQIEINDGSNIQIEKFSEENLYKNEVESFCNFLDNNGDIYFGTNIKDALLGVNILNAISKSFRTQKSVRM